MRRSAGSLARASPPSNKSRGAPILLRAAPLLLLALYAAGHLDRAVQQALVLALGAWASVRVGAWAGQRRGLTSILPAFSAFLLIPWVWSDLSALKQKARTLEASFARAGRLESQGRAAEALSLYEALAREAPASPEIHFALGRACLFQDRREEARTHLRQTVRLSKGEAPWGPQAKALLLLLGDAP